VGEAAGFAEAAVAGAADELRVSALGTQAVVLLLAGADERAEAAAREAFEHPDAAERPNGYVAACAVLALLEARRARPSVARTEADRALAATARYDLDGRPVGALAALADALTAALEGRLQHAERRAVRAARTTIAGGVWEAWMLLELTAIRIRRGYVAAAA